MITYKNYLDCTYNHPRGIVQSNFIYGDLECISLTEYEDICEYLDIIFFEGFHFKSRIVQYYTFSPFSHVGIFLGKNVHTSFAEVVPREGFTLGSIAKYKKYKGNMYVARIQSLGTRGPHIANTIFEMHQHTKYINRVVYQVLQKIINRRSSKKSYQRIICSELVEDVFKLLDLDYKNREGDLVYPSDIEKSEDVKLIYKLAL